MRVIKASLFAGFTDLAIGLIMSFTGLHEWYYDKFRFFGVLGLAMITYGTWHYILYKKDGAKHE